MSEQPKELPNPPDVACCWPENGGCVCGPTERALRAWVDNRAPRPMSAEQRDWCVAEISSIEGWDRYVPDADDASLARDVLSAWRDYVRDKGVAL